MPQSTVDGPTPHMSTGTSLIQKEFDECTNVPTCLSNSSVPRSRPQRTACCCLEMDDWWRFCRYPGANGGSLELLLQRAALLLVLITHPFYIPRTARQHQETTAKRSDFVSSHIAFSRRPCHNNAGCTPPYPKEYAGDGKAADHNLDPAVTPTIHRLEKNSHRLIMTGSVQNDV